MVFSHRCLFSASESNQNDEFDIKHEIDGTEGGLYTRAFV